MKEGQPDSAESEVIGVNRGGACWQEQGASRICDGICNHTSKILILNFNCISRVYADAIRNT